MNQADKNNYYKEIGRRIKRAREVAGLTQSELGKKLSIPITATAIFLYEKGKREVSIKVLTEISKILNVSHQFLMLNEEEKNIPSTEIALLADKDISSQGKKQILDYIEYVKSRSPKEKNGK